MKMKNSHNPLIISNLRRSGRPNRLIINDLRQIGYEPNQNARREDYESNICY